MLSFGCVTIAVIAPAGHRGAAMKVANAIAEILKREGVDF